LIQINPLAAEILQEAGQAYFAGCKKMVASLEALRAFDRVVVPSVHDAKQVTRRSQLLDDAAERVHFVLILAILPQRLAHSELSRYGIP